MPPHPKAKIDTLIVSDVHLGSLISRAQKLNQLLESTDFRRLILLGDLFDGLNFQRLNGSQWELLSRIRTLSSEKEGRDVIWIRGNHDGKIADTMSHLVGARVFDEYAWEFRGKRFLAIHGDQFDRFFISKTSLGRLPRWIFVMLQRFDQEGRHIVGFLERSHTAWLRLSRKVADGAAKYASALQADLVFCGHTHEAMEQVFPAESDGASPVHYVNVGCWTRSPSSYAVIDEAGKVSLREFA